METPTSARLEAFSKTSVEDVNPHRGAHSQQLIAGE